MVWFATGFASGTVEVPLPEGVTGTPAAVTFAGTLLPVVADEALTGGAVPAVEFFRVVIAK